MPPLVSSFPVMVYPLPFFAECSAVLPSPDGSPMYSKSCCDITDPIPVIKHLHGCFLLIGQFLTCRGVFFEISALPLPLDSFCQVPPPPSPAAMLRYLYECRNPGGVPGTIRPPTIPGPPPPATLRSSAPIRPSSGPASLPPLLMLPVGCCSWWAGCRRGRGFCLVRCFRCSLPYRKRIIFLCRSPLVQENI